MNFHDGFEKSEDGPHRKGSLDTCAYVCVHASVIPVHLHAQRKCRLEQGGNLENF